MPGDATADRPAVRFEVEDGIGLILIDNPPVNALSPDVREGIVAAVEKGEAAPNVKAMVMLGAGRSFIAGAPTIVNNTETLAHVPGILRHGAAWYRALGLGGAAGTKLYSLSGDVLRPGLYELPMGTRLETLIFEHGGGMLQGKEFKAVFTGGPSNTLLTKRDLDRVYGLVMRDARES